MFRIGDFSKMSKTTIKALRYYDEIGLLKPEHIDPFTGYRFYTSAQLMALHQIQAFRQIGLSIDEIQCILAGEEPMPILEKRKTEIEKEIKQRTDMLSRIEFVLLQKEEDVMSGYQAIIKEVPSCIVYSKKVTVPDYGAYFEVIPAIGAQVMEKYPDLCCATPEYCYIHYLDGEYRERDIHIEFCEAVTEKKEDFDGIIFKEIPAVTVVSVMHKGEYQGFPQAYAFAFKWIEQNGYAVSGNPRESYIDGIWNKEDPAEWLTELQIPIRKIK